MFRGLPLLGALLGATLMAPPAWSAEGEDKQACFRAYEQAQTQRKAGRFGAARTAIASCLEPRCPAALARDCRTWQGELEAAQPTVVLSARDPAGAAVDAEVDDADVRVAERLDGVSVALDPGEHHLVFRARDGRRAEAVVVLREGDKNRRVEATFAPAAGPRTAEPAPSHAIPLGPPERPVPVASWIFGGVAASSLASFGLFAGLGLAARGKLDEQRCKPDCKPDDVRTVQRDFYVADVSLEVGLVTGAIAVALYVLRPEVQRPARSGLAWSATPGGLRTAF